MASILRVPIDSADTHPEPVSTRPATKPRAKTAKSASPEPSFSDLVTDLSIADFDARTASANASEARNKRSTIAVSTIHAAFREKHLADNVRAALLDGGVLKGTVSKIVTVLDALHAGIIVPVDVVSLNGAYTSVKAYYKAVAASGILTPGAVPYSTPVPATVATTPEDALQIIIDTVKSISDPEEAFRVGGEWMTRVTNGITDVLKSREDDED